MLASDEDKGLQKSTWLLIPYILNGNALFSSPVLVPLSTQVIFHVSMGHFMSLTFFPFNFTAHKYSCVHTIA